jgi:hypothetical protein
VRHSEVEDLHLAALAQEDVAGSEVAVDDSMRVRVSHPLRRLGGDAQGFAERDRALSQRLRECPPMQELEDEVGPLLAVPHVEERDDVRMAQPRRGFRLTQQLLLPHLGCSDPPQRLQCDRPPQLPVACLVDHAQAAPPELAHQLEPADDLPGPEELGQAFDRLDRRQLL